MMMMMMGDRNNNNHHVPTTTTTDTNHRESCWRHWRSRDPSSHSMERGSFDDSTTTPTTTNHPTPYCPYYDDRDNHPPHEMMNENFHTASSVSSTF